MSPLSCVQTKRKRKQKFAFTFIWCELALTPDNNLSEMFTVNIDFYLQYERYSVNEIKRVCTLWQ